MRFLFLCDPFNKKQADEAYAGEFSAAKSAGFACSLFSVEDLEGG